MREKFKILTSIFALLLTSSVPLVKAEAINCPDLRIVFVRGSGGERWTTNDYLEYKSTIEQKLENTNLNYEFIDLDYPAVGVGADNLKVTIDAYIGAGDAYEFGDSVNAGVANLAKLVNNECSNTQYVIGGYSQGAMVVSKSLQYLNPSKVLYAATFGDPKIYLPEGKGLIPKACTGKNLSDYRAYVPDCRAYKGLLGAYEPYRPDALANKVGTWCNKRDLFCSSHFILSDHLAYISDNLYEDASRVIYNKIADHFHLENKILSPHDTAILIDSSGSMANMIDQYKNEALRLAKQTLDSGGRVALYDYRDLDDPYNPIKHCNFETCTLESFETALQSIVADGGGDTPESLLSASFHTMKTLKWKRGATKSLVILTDSNFLSPDRDGITLDQVVSLSKTIDPVNFYIITNPENNSAYQELAESTDGKVVTNLDELNLLTDYILDRYDSLPRVEETTDFVTDLPTLEITSVKEISETEYHIEFSSDVYQTLVILNDSILGITSEKSITIGDLDSSKTNTLSLVPIKKNVRGTGVDVVLNTPKSTPKIPKAPNTGTNYLSGENGHHTHIYKQKDL